MEFYDIFEIKKDLDIAMPVVFGRHRLKEGLIETECGGWDGTHGDHQWLKGERVSSEGLVNRCEYGGYGK